MGFSTGWLGRFRRRSAPPAPQGERSYVPLPVRTPGDLDYRHINPDALFYALSLGVEYVYSAGVEGHFAEFGTAWGRTAEAIARAIRAYGPMYADSDRMHGIGERRFMLFDSFQGFPKATYQQDLSSPHVSSGVWGEGVTKALSAMELREKIARFLPDERMTVTEGWFKDSLRSIPAGIKFAFVHIDADLYESTHDVLDYLFKHKHFADGCALYFDDWYCNKGSPRFGQQRAWADCVERYRPKFSEGRDYGALSKAFRLHDW